MIFKLSSLNGHRYLELTAQPNNNNSKSSICTHWKDEELIYFGLFIFKKKFFFWGGVFTKFSI